MPLLWSTEPKWAVDFKQMLKMVKRKLKQSTDGKNGYLVISAIWRQHDSLGSLNNNDGNGYENVT